MVSTYTFTSGLTSKEIKVQLGLGFIFILIPTLLANWAQLLGGGFNNSKISLNCPTTPHCMQIYNQIAMKKA